MITRVVETSLPTDFGRFRVFGYRDEAGGQEHLAWSVATSEAPRATAS